MKNFWLDRKSRMTEDETFIIEGLFVKIIQGASRFDNWAKIQWKMLDVVFHELGSDRFFQLANEGDLKQLVDEWAELASRINKAKWREADADEIRTRPGSGSNRQGLDPQVSSTLG